MEPFKALAVQAAKKAGQVLQGRLGRTRRVDYKGAANLVTEHTVNHPLTCATCHSSTDTTVRNVIATYGGTNPLNPRCVECHTAATSAHVAECLAMLDEALRAPVVRQAI